MTIAQIYEEAKRQLDKGIITIGEFSEIVDREYQEPSKWIPCSERLPELDEEACSDNVLVSLRKTTWDINKCQMVHVTKIAYYDKYAICSDGMYFDTEGWVLENGNTLSMDEVVAWQPLPHIYKVESEE